VATERREPARWIWPAASLAAAAVLLLVIAGGVLTGPQTPAAGNGPATTADADTPRRADIPALAPVVREFTAGVHYETLATPVPTSTGPDTIEVCEFFAFTCPHCFSLEALVETWVDRQPDDVVLARVPVLWNEIARLHAQAFYTAEALGRLDDFIVPMFVEMHERGNYLASVDEIRAFFGRQGISAAEFDSAFASRRVEAGMRRAEELNRLYGIDSTPTITVNGRYATGPSMAGSYEAVFDVVDALIESERSARSQSRPFRAAEQAISIDKLIDLIRN
jgi:thiol:disulfide interchange protein DsbA